MGSEEKRYALLIDSDNVSAKYIDTIFDELADRGMVTVRRIYGDWARSVNGWNRATLLRNSIVPIQQFAYTQGKNATDSAMIIDAMDLLYTGNLDGFCLVSSDSDFTRLAERLREAGKEVVGMGENKTPEAFVKACTSSFAKISHRSRMRKMLRKYQPRKMKTARILQALSLFRR